MKAKCIALLLALLLCLPLAACQGAGEEGGQSKTMAETQKEAAQAKASAEAKENEGKDVLRVVTDQYIWAGGDSTLLTKGGKALTQMVEYFEGTPSGADVELVILPDMNHGYDAELPHIRTEIMAGGGPDVFLMSGFGGSFSGTPANTLFQNPEHAMAAGFFLPLDEYIETAKLMEFDQLEPKVMEAGQYEGKQYIMPMSYLIPAGILRQTPQAPVAGWDAVVASGGPELRRLYAQATVELPGFRETAFGRIADNAGEELLISQEELFQRTKEALALYREFPQRAAAATDSTNAWIIDRYLLDGVSEEDETYYFFPMGNGQGGVSAAVQQWSAVNAHTERPEDAFFVIDMLLSRSVQSRQLFWPTKDLMNSAHSIPLLGLDMAGTLPVYTGLVTSGGFIADTPLIGESQSAGLKETQANIDYAYVTGSIDREMDRMYMGLVEKVDSGSALSDEEVRKETDQCYSTMKMMLAES